MLFRATVAFDKFVLDSSTLPESLKKCHEILTKEHKRKFRRCAVTDFEEIIYSSI